MIFSQFPALFRFLFLALDLLPTGLILLRRTVRLIPRYMGMTAHHFLCQTIHHICHGELSFFLGNSCMKKNLEKYISKFFTQVFFIMLFDCLYHFLAFVAKTRDQTLMRCV